MCRIVTEFLLLSTVSGTGSEQRQPATLAHVCWLTAGKNKVKEVEPDVEGQQSRSCTPASVCRKGWIWAVVVAGILIGVSHDHMHP